MTNSPCFCREIRSFIALMAVTIAAGCGVVNVEPDAVSIVINELRVAPAGNGVSPYDTLDWVELYNAGTQPVNLNRFYFSDSPTNRLRYALEDTAIMPGGFYVLFCSSVQDSASPACGFALSTQKSSVDIAALYDTSGDEVDIVNFRRFIPLLGNKDDTFGRLVDGSREWVCQQKSSPGESNNGI